MAGGVVWAAAGVAGDAAAIEAGVEAPEVSEGHSDDTTCPDPKTRCADCTAIADMCTTGNNQDCACEDHSCPTEKPQCPSCNGKDGEYPAERNAKLYLLILRRKMSGWR
jgi:hypothetical protein